MDNRADEKTTINVKSVSVAAWDRAKKAATKQGEAMGEWLSRAINQLADIEAGPREFPPANPPVNQISETGNPVRFALSPAELSDLMHAQAALTTATGKLPAKADTGRAHALAAEMVRAAIGMPPKPLRIGKAPAKKINKMGNPALANGQAAPMIGGRTGSSKPGKLG